MAAVDVAPVTGIFMALSPAGRRLGRMSCSHGKLGRRCDEEQGTFNQACSPSSVPKLSAVGIRLNYFVCINLMIAGYRSAVTTLWIGCSHQSGPTVAWNLCNTSLSPVVNG